MPVHSLRRVVLFPSLDSYAEENLRRRRERSLGFVSVEEQHFYFLNLDLCPSTREVSVLGIIGID